MRDLQWLSFAPRYTPSWQQNPMKAHAFLGNDSRSVCTRVARAKSEGSAPANTRQCENCVRKLQNIRQRVAKQTRHDVAASVARHAALEGFEPDWASSPGETILDLMRPRQLQPADLAARLGMTLPEIKELLEGTTELTAETAAKLAEILGGTSAFWLARETQYRADLKRLAALKSP